LPADAAPRSGPLSLVDDELASCVSCGLCLPHCPTFRVTGDESKSPRGRITAMRAVESGAIPVDDPFIESMTSCIQCRGCETACPSGVPFGHLMSDTRVALAGRTVSAPVALGYRLLASPRLVRGASLAAAIGQRLGIVASARLGLPSRLPIRRPRLAASGDDVWVFTGCVMDAWQRDIHVALARLVESTGRGVALPGRGGGCCGALAAHAGLDDTARRRAESTMASMPGDAPVLVDSAGCGAALRDYGELVGTEMARSFSARVVDASQWLADHLDELPAPRKDHVRPVVAVQDPCHLRHVQRAHLPVRDLLAPYADTIELDDDGLCCGAGGAFSVTEPELADAVRARKLASIARSGASRTVSANPGCLEHLRRAGMVVDHPVTVVAAAVGVIEEDGRVR
jgi:glycolate oxidase iron-sulfur subunit